MDPDVYTAVTSVREVAVDPQGERVAFVTGEFDGAADERRSSVWTVPVDGSADPYRLTRASDAGSPQWSSDGRYLGFVATRDQDVELAVAAAEDEEGDEEDGDDGGGGDDPSAQVWVFDMERGGDARQVTDLEEGVSGFDWGPDGGRVVVAARDPSEDQQAYIDQLEEDGPIEIDRLQHKQNGTGYLDDVVSYLFVVDVETRETTRLDDANDHGYGTGSMGLQPAWGTDRIAYVSWDLDATPNPDDTAVRDVFTVTPEGEDVTRVSDADMAVSRPAWGPAGDRLAFAGRDPQNFYTPTELYVTDATRSTYQSVSASLDRPLGYGDITWVDGTTLVSTIGDEGRTLLCTFDADRDAPTPASLGGSSMATIAKGRGVDVGGETVATVRSKHDAGTDVVTCSLEALGDDAVGMTRVTTVNDDLIEAYPQPGCRRLEFDADDGESIEAFAYHPPDHDLGDDGPLPLLLKIHGGPMAYDDPGWGFEETYWTNQGYLVLEVNYRGSTSYGESFCAALRGAWNDKEVSDLLAGVDAVVDRGWVDPESMVCTGFSQGGVNTAYLITRTDRFGAAAAEHGIYDLYSSFGTDDSHVWLTADNGVPWENQDAYREQSSITAVGDVETPTLLTAGDQDWRCPPSQAEQFYVSLKKRGVAAKLVVYQNEHHAIGTPDRAIHRLEELTDWFDTHA